MRSLVGRAKRGSSRSLVEQLASLTSSGDGSTLSLDFTTGVLDSRLTFTRGSNATFINSQGLVQYADANMLINSPMQDAANPASGWNFFSGTGGTISTPVAGSRKIATTGSGQQVFTHQTINLPQGLTFTLSFVVSEITGTINYNGICLADGAASSQLWVNGAQITNFSAQAVVGSYCLIYVPGAGATTHRIGTGANSSSSGVCSMTFHSARVQPGSFTTTTYIPSNLTAAYHAPRFDHDPTTRAPRGLLLEGQAVNVASAGAGSSSNTSFTCYNTGFSPTFYEPLTLVQGIDGSNTSAASFTLSANGFVDARFGSLSTGITTFSVTSGQTYTASYYYKVTRGGNPLSINTRLVKAGTTIETPTTSVDLPGPNGFTRRVVTFTTTDSVYGVAWVYGGGFQIGDSFHITGMQVELGSGASSYIPTGASQGTRNADSCEMSNITALNYSTQTGSVYWRGIINKQPTSYTTLIGFMTAVDQPTYDTFGNALSYFASARGPSLLGGGQNEVSRAYTLGSLIRYASSINTATDPIVAVNLNGTAGSTNKSGSGDLYAATRFVIGRQPSSAYGTSYPSVTIAQIKYWPTAKTASELNALTSP
jgi:hypothetical protein